MPAKKQPRRRPVKPDSRPRPSKTSAPSVAAGGPDDLPVLVLKDAAAFQRWLARNHGSARGAWLTFARKSASQKTISYAEAVEGALCWGWIDGQARSRDEHSWLQRFTPRGARSIWSKINRAKALALIERGAMQPPGLAEVERAKRDGRWDRAYDSPRTSKVPEDLTAALAANRKAAELFETLNAANRYAILFRLQNAKRPETRARRIETFVTMLARGEKLHP